MKDIFEGKIILVTGGLGSIGSEIVRKLLSYNPKQIRVMDNRETELFYAESKFDKKICRFFYGDVRDRKRILRATEDVNIVFHAAALKHVFRCEYDPFEAIKTNVLGTQNIIESSLQNNVEKVVLISTDKAVNPFTVMGSTKLLAERLISSMFHYVGKNSTKFAAVRFGNVLASRGSVLEAWGKQIKNGDKITVTNPDMTRFFMTIPKSVDLIFNATKYVNNGETYIFKMSSVQIGILAEAFLELNNLPKDNFKIIGMKNGEKMHEDLLFEDESQFILENNDLIVRLPVVDNDHQLYKAYENLYESYQKKGFKKYDRKEFSSADKKIILSKDEIKKILKEQIFNS